MCACSDSSSCRGGVSTARHSMAGQHRGNTV
jgi:hypothetical protein